MYFTRDGRWRATYWLPGEARPRSASGATREKAIANRAKKLEEIAARGSALSVDTSTTISELGAWWVNEIQKHQVRPTTWAKSKERVRRITQELGDRKVSDLRAEDVVAWQSEMLKTLAPKTVSHHRQTLAQIVDQAVELEVVPANVVRRVKPPKVPASSGRALSIAEVQALVAAARYDRYGAAVALLFLQGWRVSECLGLAWEDLDLDNGTALVRRACVYIAGEGSQLGPTKTTGVMGRHTLTPTVVEMLRTRHVQQEDEQRRCNEYWPSHNDLGQLVHPVFTTPTGQLVIRQSISKSVTRAAAAAEISTERLGTHTGRRSVVTALYAAGGESIEEIARFVGHASPATTAGYVRDLGKRPEAFAKRAAELLDPSGATSDA